MRPSVLLVVLLVGSGCRSTVPPPDPRDDAAGTEAPRTITTERLLFTDVSAAAGVERPDPSLLERGGRGLLSHGAAAADVDGDGLVDVFAVGLTRHALYLNRGDGTFEDVAEQVGLHVSSAPACAAVFFDADDDGDQDLFLSGLGHQSLFENRLVPDGRLYFRDVSASAGVQVERAGFSVAVGDLDGNGLPDIVVAAYGDYGNVVPDSWIDARNGQPNLLFLNEGGLRFREAAATAGLADARWSYAVLVADVDEDGDLDVIVANDFGGATGLFLNDGKGRFRDEAESRGLGAPSYGMGLSLGDFDRDGDLDLHVTKASSPLPAQVLGKAPEDPLHRAILVLASGNSLYENLGGGMFRLSSSHATGWSWGGGFVDLDSDGWPDLHVPSGFLSGEGSEDTDDLFWRQVIESVTPGGQTQAEFFALQVPAILDRGASFAGHERDAVLLNDGRGGFVDVSTGSGLDSPADSRAAVHADFDDDGDADVFVRAMHGRAHLLFRNDSVERPRFVRLTLRGARGRDACGALVRVTGGGRTTAQARLCGSGFLSQSDPRLLFGLGSDDGLDAIDVRWPSGRVQSFGPAPAGASLLLIEGEPEAVPLPTRPFVLGRGMIDP